MWWKGVGTRRALRPLPTPPFPRDPAQGPSPALVTPTGAEGRGGSWRGSAPQHPKTGLGRVEGVGQGLDLCCTPGSAATGCSCWRICTIFGWLCPRFHFPAGCAGECRGAAGCKAVQTEPGGNSWGEGTWIFWDRLSGAPPSHPLPRGEPPAHLHPALSWDGAGEQCRVNPGGSCCWKLLEKAQLQQWQQQLDTAAPPGTPGHPRASTEKPPALKQSHTHSTSHTQDSGQVTKAPGSDTTSKPP